MMEPAEMAPISAQLQVQEAEEAEAAQEDEEEERAPRAPKERQTKAEKAYNKRKALLEKLSASTNPYSKSHARRVRRAAKPENNLVASLEEVEAVLPVVEALPTLGDEDEDDGMKDDDADGGKGKKGNGGKGKEKLTAKKRQRVLTAESVRLPAIIKNESFAASPFATIRQHTLNTLVTQKNPPLQKGGAGKKGKR
ncbi:hypothetical protein JCM6882_001808 [Rhodosporidiobolus microsporus]